MTVHALIEEATAYDAEYRHGLSNHLPMALLALDRLGADEARQRAFFVGYAARLQPARELQEWPAGDAWQGRLGDPEAWPAYRGLFLQWLTLEDAGDVLRQTLPVLMHGCGAAAFHGLIRTAYAVQAKHRQELADALAYWACRWLDLGDTRGGKQRDPEVLLRQLRPHAAGDAGLIFEAMRGAAQARGFDAIANGLRIDEHTLPQLAHLAAQAYAASRNFTVLHLVTSAHALRTLLPWLEDETALAAVADYWRAFAAAVSAAGIRVLPPVPLQPWSEISAVAIASHDDHLIKLVDSCREQQAAYGEGPWQDAASRAVAGRAT